jgi:hypothetical protein
MTKFCFFLALILSCQARAEKVFDVKDFGAQGNGKVVNTLSIQKAIDACFNAGGGLVNVGPGDYLTGTLILKSGVDLHLEKGATLHASRSIADYRMPLENATRPVLIYANGAHNISLSGKGSIVGHAEHVYEDLREVDPFISEYTERARSAGVEMKRFYIVKPDVALVILSDCEGIQISDITLRESSFWTLHVIKSKDVSISRITVLSSLEKGVNADGIDINSCDGVVVKDCLVRTGDDAIVIKTWYDTPCQNVVVKRCTVASSSTGLKLGTESNGDFYHILFDSCVVEDANRGLSIVVRGEGHVKDVTFSNIEVNCSRRHFNWWGNGDPIWVYVAEKSEGSKTGSVSNVRFEHIHAKGMGTSKIESVAGDVIADIVLLDVHIHMLAEDALDKRADDAWYIRQVKALRMEQCSVTWNDDATEPAWRHAVHLDEISNFHMLTFTGRQGQVSSNTAAILLNNCTRGRIEAGTAVPDTDVWVEVRGASSEDITLSQNKTVGSDCRPLLIGEEVRAEIRLLD